MEYPKGFKEAMVKKMTSPGRPTTVDLAADIGVHKSTLSRWVREAGNVDVMSKKRIKKKSGRPDDRTPEEKLQLVLEASLLNDEEMGEFLREKGLHEAQLKRWQKDALEGISNVPLSSSKVGPDARKIRDLEDKLKRQGKELRRKEKALAEAAALLVLKKKAEALWGDEEEDTE